MTTSNTRAIFAALAAVYPGLTPAEGDFIGIIDRRDVITYGTYRNRDTIAFYLTDERDRTTLYRHDEHTAAVIRPGYRPPTPGYDGEQLTATSINDPADTRAYLWAAGAWREMLPGNRLGEPTDLLHLSAAPYHVQRTMLDSLPPWCHDDLINYGATGNSDSERLTNILEQLDAAQSKLRVIKRNARERQVVGGGWYALHKAAGYLKTRGDDVAGMTYRQIIQRLIELARTYEQPVENITHDMTIADGEPGDTIRVEPAHLTPARLFVWDRTSADAEWAWTAYAPQTQASSELLSAHLHAIAARPLSEGDTLPRIIRGKI